MYRLSVLTLFCAFTICCSGQYSEQFQKIISYKACESLIDTVKQNWKYKPTKNYCQNGFASSNPGKTYIILPCIKGVDKGDCEILFGKPNYSSNLLWRYHTSPPDHYEYVESYLSISFQSGKVKDIWITNCEGSRDEFLANWEYVIDHDYYKSGFTPAKFGKKDIDATCLEHIDQEGFEIIFGKPNSGYAYSHMTAMKPVEWDDKGKKTSTKSRSSNKKTNMRYHTAPLDSHWGLPGSYMTVMFESITGEVVKMWETNCIGLKDSIETKWNYVDSLDYYRMDFDMVEMNVYSECLLPIDSNEVVEIFGKPSSRNPNYPTPQWRYYINPNDDKDEYKGNFLVFDFSKEGVLFSIHLSFYTVPSH